MVLTKLDITNPDNHGLSRVRRKSFNSLKAQTTSAYSLRPRKYSLPIFINKFNYSHAIINKRKSANLLKKSLINNYYIKSEEANEKELSMHKERLQQLLKLEPKSNDNERSKNKFNNNKNNNNNNNNNNNDNDNNKNNNINNNKYNLVKKIYKMCSITSLGKKMSSAILDTIKGKQIQMQQSAEGNSLISTDTFKNSKNSNATLATLPYLATSASLVTKFKNYLDYNKIRLFARRRRLRKRRKRKLFKKTKTAISATKAKIMTVKKTTTTNGRTMLMKLNADKVKTNSSYNPKDYLTKNIDRNGNIMTDQFINSDHYPQQKKKAEQHEQQKQFQYQKQQQQQQQQEQQQHETVPKIQSHQQQQHNQEHQYYYKYHQYRQCRSSSTYFPITTLRLLFTTLTTLTVSTIYRICLATTSVTIDSATQAVTVLPALLPTPIIRHCCSCKLNANVILRNSWILLLIYMNLSANVCLAGYHEKRLLHDLLDPYNTLERPVLNESDPLQLSFGLTLMQIIDVDEKNQLLVTNVWLKLEWNDMNLRWNTSDYGGIKDLRIPPHRIWKPDVLMYNSADEGFDGTYQTNVVVRNNGSCLYVPPGIFKSTCKIDITWFPFDDQRCEMKFGSWTYDGFQLDLQLQDETGGDISSYVLNGEWELLGVPGKRNEIYYNCCPEPYIDITFAIIIRRRTLYYFFNLIIPCVLIASMALLGFTLPPDSGEKLSLGVTILLSLTVFLNMVAETMPATSDAVPLLGTYFNCIMFMVASSVVSTILILNYHHRNADTHEMSEWIRLVFLCWLPWLLRMSRPGRPLILEFPATPCSDTSSERKHQILSDVELKERSSKSLLANVLDIDDDFRHGCRPMTPGGTLPHNPAFYRTVYGQGDDGSIGPIGSTRMPDAVTHHTCIKSSTEYELSLILKEIRFITDQLRKEDEENDIANDWKFAAMVVDRLCLIIFTIFTILATIAVLLSAPHIIVS